MKKTKLAFAIAAAAMVSTPVLATNGDNLIGLGAQARALGGTGTAAFFGAENALTNPALLGKSVGTEFSIGGTAFMPDVEVTTNVATQPGQPAAKQKSENDMNIIPEVALSTRINENLTFGLGMFGSAGMGVDYRDNGGLPAGSPMAGGADGTGLFNGYSNLQLMKFAPSLAYNADNFGLGFAPVIQYGSLDINYKRFDQGSGAVNNVGNGMSTDLGFGFNLGGYFDITKELTIALAYQSAISMEYEDQITTAAAGFNVPAGMLSDDLEQPAEIKIGIAYTMDNWMFTADAKQIKWGSAEGYKDFNWDDQEVFAIGAKYSGKDYWLGAGFNYASDPIEVMNDQSGNMMADGLAQTVNLFNNHFFPGIVEKHFTFGGGYNLTKNMAIDAALVYAPTVTKTVNSGYLSMQPSADATTHKVEHSQIGYTVALRMNF